jgi:hypothetical protein
VGAFWKGERRYVGEGLEQMNGEGKEPAHG